MIKDYDPFFDLINLAVAEFKKIEKGKKIRIISHFDSDGISSCSILVSALKREGYDYSVLSLQQLTIKEIEKISSEDYDVFFFTDIGSSQTKEISEAFSGKKVFVLDHHMTNDEKFENVIHVNPHISGVCGNNEVSAAGVVFFFCEKLNKMNVDMAHIAIVGAVGDAQEHNGFLGLNNEILNKAVNENKITIKKGLKLFGQKSKPLYKVLQHSTNPFIPGVTGSEENVFEFLKELEIEPKSGKSYRKLRDLSNKEKDRLAEGLIRKRKDEKDPEDIYGNMYLIPGEKEDSPTRDAKEMSTLLNACGRLERAELGVGVCLGNKELTKEAIGLMQSYRQEILKSMSWFIDKNKKKKFIYGEGYIIIDACGRIRSTIIGTICSMIAKSRYFDDNVLIIALSNNKDESIKVSLRESGRNSKFNLKEIICSVCVDMGECQCGGHKSAAGTIFSKEYKEKFIEKLKSYLDLLD